MKFLSKTHFNGCCIGDVQLCTDSRKYSYLEILALEREYIDDAIWPTDEKISHPAAAKAIHGVYSKWQCMVGTRDLRHSLWCLLVNNGFLPKLTHGILGRTEPMMVLGERSARCPG